MSWDEECGDSGDEIKRITMVCDYCGKRILWYDSEDSDEPGKEEIQRAKDTHGWANVGVHIYENNPDRPADVEVEAIQYHACPTCREGMLCIVLLEKED